MQYKYCILPMDEVFKALSDPSRRKMLDRLFDRPGLTLGELTGGLAMRRQSATRHVGVLVDAGLVTAHWHGREKRHYLNPVPIAEIGRRWIDKFSGAKAEAIINLRQALEDNDDD